ncbi:hypothetical protein MLGJGCBP_04811 [Rhodococcus sp. T7]|nr:hypothetical protein MLGJGCBP_09939 [Rhodococcus sp. T7]KAF0962029.1 hypothetical protein MLGJGCBP_04811 [Rhodococcus sp. T7]CAG7642570.1 hypothetical protein E143388_08415 [Rhodococcus opacus]
MIGIVFDIPVFGDPIWPPGVWYVNFANWWNQF